jgi:hypothetical protein
MRHAFLFLCLFLTGLSASTADNPVPSSSVTVSYAAGHEEQFPFEPRDEPLFKVKVNSNPRQLFFSIDSGSAATYLDTRTAEQLDLKPSGSGTVHGAGTGRVTVQHIDNVRFELPSVITTHPEINTIDLGGTEVGDHKLDGFFGFDFIRQFVVTIDYDAKLITLDDPATFTYRGDGSILPVEFRGKWPYIPGIIKVPGVPAEQTLFLVDSGSGDAVNHPLIKRSTGKLVKTRAGVGVGTSEEGVRGKIEFVRFGRLLLRDAPSVCCGGEGDLRRYGQIGNDALRRFRVILDYAHDRIILEPGKNYSKPF